MAKVWKIRKRINPLPGLPPGVDRRGMEIRTAISINSAAYRKGSTARAATSRAVIANPKGTKRRRALVAGEETNQKKDEP
jgi:hypothetical protein